MTKTQLEGQELALECARQAAEMQAEEIRILDVTGLSTVADFFVICSGSSSPHLRAIRREVADRVKEEHGLAALHKEGSPESQWMVIDYVDVMVHIFREEAREYYALEDLWSDARPVPFEAPQP
ncbi:MAG: ribosome silencing factor [Verrucomicrobiota bacterium]